ncbi:manganese/iron transport system permease protein [Hasllibacter halocynthiae]|uniref:Manganese/iron transport system permease protein n=1 Tax=Hasllibacter halocynthiae TaxID=595589 RepID=A0A2T0X920_9RHOB|nr:metal ABC transporter permease [Hasllibacter halocynthiae]PRY95440.1 manganese/iron transport system permease protein [Hasllibacter halocynthiae]
MSELLLPFQLPFMADAMLIAAIVAVPAALLSCFMVLQGLSLMGDAVSHAVLPGVVIGYLAGIPFGLSFAAGPGITIGAFVAGMGCALLVGWIDENARVKRDTVMGVVFSGMFAIGIVLYAAVRTELHLDHILFGDMLGILPVDLWTALGIAVVVTAWILLSWRDLALVAFDPVQARAVGLRTRTLRYGLLAALSATVVAALKAVGLILAIAILIAPGAIAFLVTRRLGAMLSVATLISVVAGVLGVYLSFFIDSAPAPTIVLLLTLTFVAAFVRATIRART